MACVGNPDAKSTTVSKNYSLSRQIKSIEITANLVVIHKQN
jgi:hypothetical protein